MAGARSQGTFPDLAMRDLEGTARPLSEAWSHGEALVLIGHGDCKTTLEMAMSCSSQYEYLLQCRIEQNIVCTADVSLACQSAEESYTACMANP